MKPSPRWCVLSALGALLAVGCSSGSDEAEGASAAAGAAGTAGTASAGGAGSAGTQAGGGASGSGGTVTGGASGSGTAGTTSAAGAAGSAAGPSPKPEFLPKPTGACPDIVQGKITVAPGGKARDVQIWITSAAETLDGPIVFYWHGTGSSPTLEAPYGMGSAQIAAINALGGIVVAPYHDPAAGTYPWFLTSGSGPDDDLKVADEVLACAIEKVGVDTRRIHAMGMSAGGLQTVQMSYRRSGYLASVVVYSGGQILSPPNQDASNKFPAMVFHGGASDTYGGFGFESPSKSYKNALTTAGHFAFLCDHGLGHKIPTAAVASTWKFLSDHPFGTAPSPYAAGLPAEMPSYCAL